LWRDRDQTIEIYNFFLLFHEVMYKLNPCSKKTKKNSTCVALSNYLNQQNFAFDECKKILTLGYSDIKKMIQLKAIDAVEYGGVVGGIQSLALDSGKRS